MPQVLQDSDNQSLHTLQTLYLKAEFIITPVTIEWQVIVYELV